MQYFLIVHNPNFPYVKKFFKDEDDVYNYILDMKRCGPIDLVGTILPVKDETEYLESSVTVVKVDETLKVHRRLLKTIDEKACPVILKGEQLKKYLEINDPDAKYNRHRSAA